MSIRYLTTLSEIKFNFINFMKNFNCADDWHVTLNKVHIMVYKMYWKPFLISNISQIQGKIISDFVQCSLALKQWVFICS